MLWDYNEGKLVKKSNVHNGQINSMTMYNKVKFVILIIRIHVLRLEVLMDVYHCGISHVNSGNQLKCIVVKLVNF
jgi:hypothetical protein